MWQGWFAIGVYVLLILGLALMIDENSSTKEVVFTFLLPTILLTSVLIWICYKKGESPKWQWGLPKDE